MDQPQVTSQETDLILKLAQSTLPQRGDWVEFGCYKGATSVELGKLLKSVGTSLRAQNSLKSLNSPDLDLSPASPPKLLYLYDSFAGLPEKTREDASSAGENFRAGELFVTKKEVVDKLRRTGLNMKQIRIKKAFFSDLNPETDLPELISFAFLDGDLYESIKTSLALVSPRLAKQGIIIVHDYNNPELPGAARAVDEFLKGSDYQIENRFSLAILRQ